MAQRKTTKAARPAAEPAKPAATEAEEPVVEAAAKPVVNATEQAVAVTTQRVEAASGALFQGYDDFANVGKGNIDAYIEFSTIVAQGMESLSKQVMDYAQASLEANLVVAKSMMTAKTLREAIDLQTDHTRDSFDSMIDEAAKLTEMSVAVANQAMEPIQARVNATTESWFKPLAA